MRQNYGHLFGSRRSFRAQNVIPLCSITHNIIYQHANFVLRRPNERTVQSILLKHTLDVSTYFRR